MAVVQYCGFSINFFKGIKLKKPDFSFVVKKTGSVSVPKVSGPKKGNDIKERLTSSSKRRKCAAVGLTVLLQRMVGTRTSWCMTRRRRSTTYSGATQAAKRARRAGSGNSRPHVQG